MTNYKNITRAMYGSLTSASNIDELVDTYIAEDFVEHEALPGMDTSRETPRELFKALVTAMPDFHADVHDVLQDGDRVTVRATFSGTHKGKFMEIAPQGNHVDINVIDILQFRDDKIVAHWGVMDLTDALQQMSAKN